MGNRYQGVVRAGPRDVFVHGPIRTTVVRALASVGMDSGLIADLLGVDPSCVYDLVNEITGRDVVRWIREETHPDGEQPDIAKALHEWAVRSEYREDNMRKAYAAACEMSLREFENPGKWDDGIDEYVAFRVNHEVLQALSLWLAIDEFERRSEARSGHYEAMLRVVCEDDEYDRNLAAMVQLAFQDQLQIPFDLTRELWKETIRVACERGIPSSFGGGNLSSHLSSVEWEIVRKRVRPFVAPMWPSGTGDRVRDILRSREWTGDEAAEARWLCDGVTLHRAASAAYEPMRQALGRKDTETVERLRPEVNAALKAATDMSRALSNDHAARHATHQRIAAWLAEAHPELIELVRPCGNPLGAAW